MHGGIPPPSPPPCPCVDTTVSVCTRPGPALFLRNSSRADSSRCRRAPGTSRSRPPSSIPLIIKQKLSRNFPKYYLCHSDANRGFLMPFSENWHFLHMGHFLLLIKTHYKITKCPIFVVRAFFKWPYVVKSLFRPFFTKNGAFRPFREVGNPALPCFFCTVCIPAASVAGPRSSRSTAPAWPPCRGRPRAWRTPAWPRGTSPRTRCRGARACCSPRSGSPWGTRSSMMLF